MPVYNHHFHDANKDPNPVGLQQFGPIAAVEIHVPAALAQTLQAANQPVPAPASGWALIDTGATRTAVDAAALKTLDVNPIGITQVGTAGGPVTQPIFPAALRFPAMANLHIEFSSVTGVDLTSQNLPDGRPLLCLIGRDVLSRGILIYNGSTGSWTLAL